MLTAAPLPDLVLRADPDAEPAPGDPMPVDVQPAVAPQPVDRTATPLPAPTTAGIDVTKPSAPRKPAIAPAPAPEVFAPAQASPVVAPVAVKGPATPADPARVEDGVPVDAEDTDPTSTDLPLTMALPPVLPDLTTTPLLETATATPHPSADTDAGSATHGAPATAPATPVAAPAAGQPLATPGKVEASPDRPAAVAAVGLRPVREEAAPADPKPVTAATPDPRSFGALVEPKVVTSAPAPVAAAPVPEARVAAEPGRMGHEMAVAIARHTAEGGGEALTVRLNPAEFGRIDVTLSFDDRGTLRAVLAAETPAALDLLRRDSADLGRALSDAGMRTDAQSFRFDTRQGGADAGGQGAQGQPRWQAAATPRNASTITDLPEPEYRPLRSRGGVDLMA
ncbi:flagellar hook-length control protein FliK [Sphingomonas sp. CFBP 8760]|uniref:flagellar hook-length control protein FliK n=1 Tax=Sphingomonas sp. CFBP 8760 TaxID=2775282 RepID=UPI00177E9F74|nr:flagellar hook-length control protein FliK [Sphingomonas sp. CFBP 8760]